MKEVEIKSKYDSRIKNESQCVHNMKINYKNLIRTKVYNMIIRNLKTLQ